MTCKLQTEKLWFSPAFVIYNNLFWPAACLPDFAGWLVGNRLVYSAVCEHVTWAPTQRTSTESCCPDQQPPEAVMQPQYRWRGRRVQTCRNIDCRTVMWGKVTVIKQRSPSDVEQLSLASRQSQVLDKSDSPDMKYPCLKWDLRIFVIWNWSQGHLVCWTKDEVFGSLKLKFFSESENWHTPNRDVRSFLSI